MLTYRFYLKDNQEAIPAYVEVDEPIGWDSVAFTLQRSDLFDGIENIYSDDLTFYGNATDILKSAFLVAGFDALLDFKIEFYCNNTLDTTIEQVVNMLTYRRVGNETTVKMEQSSFDRKFLNRYETKVNFDDLLSVEGEELTPITAMDLPLHSKQIIVESSRELDDIYDKTVGKYSVLGNQVDYVAPPWNMIIASATNITNGSGSTNADKTFYFQYDFSKIVTSDENIGTFYDLPYGASETASPYLKVKYSGNININLKFNTCLITNTIDNSSNGLGLLAKVNGCSDGDSTNGLRLVCDYTFEVYIKIGATEYTYPIVIQTRSGCSEQYYGDAIGKVNWEEDSDDPQDGDDITTKPDKFRFIDVAINETYACNADDDIYVLIRLRTEADYERRLANTRVIVFGYTWIDKTGSFLNFSNVSQEDPSTTKAYKVYEAFNRVCESITDTQNSFRSDFFGRLDSSPQTYDTIGCGGLTAVTNGLNIRKMLDKDGNLFPFSTSFYDLFRSFNAIWNLGARIEQDDDGNYYVRVEPKEYFYDNSEEIFQISEASDIETVVAIDKLYNDIEIGYEKYAIDNVNGMDEVNTKHFYAIPVVNVKKKLEAGGGNGALSPFVGGGYAIEMTRRQQYSAQPTTDWTYDNDNFIICLNRIEVTTDVYTNPPVSTSYGIGTVPERDESYTSVTNLISPETAYNLRISPANMMFSWFKSVAPALILKSDKRVKYRYGFNNVLMTTERTDECSIASGTITENQDITVESTKFTDILRVALFTPVYINFVYPIHFGNFITIKDGSNKLIRVECGDTTYFGFIKELKFTPNDGSATFKILLTACVGGGFDSGFDSGFETGTC